MKLNTVRITWLSIRVPTSMPEGGIFPETGLITAAWTTPAAVGEALPYSWRHPWLDTADPPQPVDPDETHWLEWCERPVFTGRFDPPFVSDLIRKAVPLFADAPLTVIATAAPLNSLRAELFLHPWAVSSAVSATLQLPAAADLAAAAAAATAFRAAPNLVSIALASTRPLDPVSVAHRLAEQCIAASGAAIDPAMPQLDPVVVATVIDGDPGPKHHVRPAPENSSFRDAMHELAGDAQGGAPMRWIKTITTADPYCDETRVINVLRTGVSQWLHDSIEKMPVAKADRTMTVHRRTVLRLIVLRSAHALLERQAAPRALLERQAEPRDPWWLPTTVDELTELLIRHYAPSKLHRNLLAQSYIDLHELNPLLRNPTPKYAANCP